MKNFNKFITFEGGEGVGKSTVIKIVGEKLKALNFNTLITREPGGKDLPFSEEIRKIIMEFNNIDLLTEFLLFSASRREHMTKLIIPSLNEGKIVLCDRFIDSSLVYQGLAKGLDVNTINTVNKMTIGEYEPIMTFIFDVDPEIAVKRIIDASRGTNRFDNESIDFHKLIWKGYQSLLRNDQEKYINIDASKTHKHIANEIVEIIIERLNLNDQTN